MADYEDKKVNDKQFTLFNNESGKSYQIPLIESKDGPNVLDIRKLYQETGLFTFDPGFTSTASCESGITYICLLYTSPSPRDCDRSRMPSSA